MTGRTPPQNVPEDDFERTAELPVLDVNALEAVPGWVRARAGEAGPRSRSTDALMQAESARIQAQAQAEDLARQLEERRRVEQVLRDEVACLREQAQEQPLAAALTQAETRIQGLLAMAGQHSATLTEASAEIARLRTVAEKDAVALEEGRRRCEALEAELTRTRLAPGVAVATAQADPALRARLAARDEELRGLKESASASALWQRELMSQMRLAEGSLQRAQAELEEAKAELARTRANEAQLFTAAQQAQAAELAAREHLGEREVLLREIRQQLQVLWEDALMPRETGLALMGGLTAGVQTWRIPPGVTRLLIRTDSDTEVPHVLGERTSIGRSTDNDLQLDVTSISRHHALILAGPVQTIIEDLHSTNGVRVNGRRVKRQSLRDGDTVLIGKAQFRFVLRAVVEAE
jgi:hypothetical protein